MTTRFLVTGASGQLGGALCRTLQPLGEVVPTSEIDAPGHLLLDLTRRASVVAALDEACPHVILNPAAYTAVDRAEEEQDLAFRVNAHGAGVLAEEAARRDIPLVHYSTDYVFSGSGTEPWREVDPTAPLNVYGASKLEGERNVLAAHSGAIVIRTSWLFSAGGRNFVTAMLQLGEEQSVLAVVDDQVGAPTSAAFVATMTARILGGLPSADPAASVRAHAGLYHLTCGGETSWHGFAREIFRQARTLGFPLRVRQVRPVPTLDYPTPARRPGNSRLDCTKFFHAFPAVRPSWQEALADVMEEICLKASP